MKKPYIVLFIASLILVGCVNADEKQLEEALEYRSNIERIKSEMFLEAQEYGLALERHTLEYGMPNIHSDNFTFAYSNGSRINESTDKFVQMVQLLSIPTDLEYTRQYFLNSLESQQVAYQYQFEAYEENKDTNFKDIMRMLDSLENSWKSGMKEINKYIQRLENE